MGRRDRAQEPQSWGPRNPQGSTPPPGARPAPPQGPPPSGYRQTGTTSEPKKRRRIFLWLFLAVQVLFLVWVVMGTASGSGTSDECRGLTGDDLKLCDDAGDVGTAIGVGLVIALWAAVDVVLGFTYLIYRLAGRRA